MNIKVTQQRNKDLRKKFEKNEDDYDDALLNQVLFLYLLCKVLFF
jgi:hypothetical protein